MIPYLGEKSKFANFIIPNIPDDIEVYCEPFSGMFGIFFNLNLNNYERTQFAIFLALISSSLSTKCKA